MKRKGYQRPAMRVTQMRQRTHMLQASLNGDVKATMKNRKFVETDGWDEE